MTNKIYALLYLRSKYENENVYMYMFNDSETMKNKIAMSTAIIALAIDDFYSLWLASLCL